MTGHNQLKTINEMQNDIYFGKEVVNRVSFLRENNKFITSAITHPSCRFLLYSRTDPLVVKSWKERLVVVTNGDGQMSGPEKVTKGLSNVTLWNKIIQRWCTDNETENPRLRDDEQPTIHFLGLEDASVGLDLEKHQHLNLDNRYKGIPYFAVDVTKSPTLTEAVLKMIIESTGIDKEDLFFSTSRKHYLKFTESEAALYSHGKMFLDWLNRNLFCPGCGSKVIPIHAGGKIKCTNSKVIGKRHNGKDKYECPVKNTATSNVSFPRTDAVIITAVTNKDRSKILLSLNKRYQIANMYTCTSGFMEPSETVEVATKREIWEETGVACSKINIVMTQPWPFPGNLMIGCLAEVEFNNENEIIDLGHDNELADARWFDVEFIRKLVYPDDDNNNSETNTEGIFIPMAESIAHTLIKLVVDQAGKSKL